MKLIFKLYREKWREYQFSSKVVYEEWLEGFYASTEELAVDPFSLESLLGKSSTLYVSQAELGRQLLHQIALADCEEKKDLVVRTSRGAGKPFIPKNTAFDTALLELKKLPERYAQIIFADYYNSPYARISEQVHISLSPVARVKKQPGVAAPSEIGQDFNFRCLLLGDPGAGKSTLLQEFPMVDSDSKTSEIELLGLTTRLSVYEIDGQEPESVTAASQRFQPQGYLCCFDLTNPESFQNLRRWIAIAKSCTDDPLPILIIATKTDLKQDIRVTREEFKSFCCEVDCLGIYTSAKLGLNMDLVFKMMSSSILSRSGLRFELPPAEPVTVNQWAGFYFSQAMKFLSLDAEEEAPGLLTKLFSVS